MNRLLKIISLVLLYLLTTAKSCNNREENDAIREQAQVTTARNNIRSACTSGNLSAETLSVFEESARLKLFDFSDYLRILADTSLDSCYRHKAANMMRRLFISGLVKDPVLTEISEFDSVRVSQPFRKTSDSSYTGSLSFSIKTSQNHQRVNSIPSKHEQIADIYLIREAILIGVDTLKTWKVFLGEITQLP